MSAAATALAAWQSFYVIVGSSAGALIGLQFVVMTLIADRDQRTSVDTLNAFGTPTVVHFGGALLVSALASVPWGSSRGPALVFAACGVAGTAYGGVVVRRARRQTEYAPVWQDWVWYMAVPSVAYLVLAGSALFLAAGHLAALSVIAAAALLLLFVGIHNAWDTVTHLVMTRSERPGEPAA